jgi:hypothetical protein
MHCPNGQLALKAAAIFKNFLGIIIAGAQAQRLLDKYDNVLLDEPDKGRGGRAAVHRGDRRRILLDSLAADMIRWGHKLTIGDGRQVLPFSCWRDRNY